MPRFKMILQYDGSDFSGWQIQAKDRTVQGVLETALARFNHGEGVRVTGSGRTDAGVHALGQVAHFDLDTGLDPDSLLRAINANLPEDIRCRELEVVDTDFHARYSAKYRQYRYQCYTGSNILFRNQAWLTGPLASEDLNSSAAIVVGDHDFLSFAKWNPDLDHYRCRVDQSLWFEDNMMLIYRIVANRFLHHMVRYLVGCMVAIAKNRFSIEEFSDLLYSPRKNVHLFKAPPQGLILEKVTYEQPM